MSSLGRIETDRSPSSSAPTVDPGFRVYSLSVPAAGSMVREGSREASASRSFGVSQYGSLCTYSLRSILRIVGAGLLVAGLGVRRGGAGGLAPEPAEVELVETVALAVELFLDVWWTSCSQMRATRSSSRPGRMK